jgi:hypothetical protein
MREVRLCIAPSELESLDRVVASAIEAFNKKNAPLRRKRERRALIEARDLVVELRLAVARADTTTSMSP